MKYGIILFFGVLVHPSLVWSYEHYFSFSSWGFQGWLHSIILSFWVCQVDLQLESGEYFLSDTKKQAKKWQEKQEKQAVKVAESKRRREEAFVPPEVCTGTLFPAWLSWFIFLFLMQIVFNRNLAKKLQIRIKMTITILVLLLHLWR